MPKILLEETKDRIDEFNLSFWIGDDVMVMVTNFIWHEMVVRLKDRLTQEYPQLIFSILRDTKDYSCLYVQRGYKC